MLKEVNELKRSNYPGSYKSRTLGKFEMSKTSKTRRLKELTGLTCLKERKGVI